MAEIDTSPDESTGRPDPPAALPVGAWRRVAAFLSSVRLAISLLIVILACCVAGATVLRGDRAWTLIFYTTWFNGILVLLVLNVAFCFFGRIWGRKVTLISLGMILFHLSFVAILAGNVYNSLFRFSGIIRLTEGEILPSGDPRSYDLLDRGPLFNMSRLKGTTELIKMQYGYMDEGVKRGAAYEIALGEGLARKQDTIYVLKHLNYKGFKYFTDKEGYSVLIILYDRQGKELYGAHLPLQSLKLKEDAYLYTSGTKSGPGILSFPPPPQKPLFKLNIIYRPDAIKERAGDAIFQVWPLQQTNVLEGDTPLAEGAAAVGDKYPAGDHQWSVKEVRYWVGMSVRYDPGLPIVLASLWMGLGGMIMTFTGRMLRDRSR